jgi:RNA polymerase sigma factor (sigma-70 family)
MGKDTPQTECFVALQICAYLAVNASLLGDRDLWLHRWRGLRDTLIIKNRGLINKFVHLDPVKEYCDWQEMCSLADDALKKSVCRFNPWYGLAFSTYACNCISRRICRHRKSEAARRKRFPVTHDPKFEKGDIAERRSDSESGLAKERIRFVLEKNIAGLTEMEQVVLNGRFPMNGPQETLQDIASMIGYTKEWVRLVQNRALRKLRAALNEDPVFN